MIMRLSCRYLLFLATTFAYVFLPTPSAAAESERNYSGIEYEVRIEGDISSNVRSAIQKTTDSFLLRNRPPATLGMLRLRAEEDLPVIRKILRAHGYYSSSVVIRIDPANIPAGVFFEISPGPLYRLGKLDIPSVGLPENIELPSRRKLQLEEGEPAAARAVFDAVDEINDQLRRSGFPFAEVATEAVVRHGTRTMDVVLEARPGPRARMGNVTVSGIQSVGEETVLNRVMWKKGDTYDPVLISNFRDRLIGLGLFATVQVETADSLDHDGLLPVSVKVRERDHRTLKVGVSYKTNEGAGSEASWEHRNLFRHANRLRLSINVAEILLAGQGTLERPDFLRPDLSLLFDVRGARERTEAYKSKSLRTSLFIERLLSRYTIAGGGISFRFSRVEQLELEERFDLVSFPVKLSRDSRDDLLDPASGWRLDIEVAPFYDVDGITPVFWKSYISTSHYIRFLSHPRSVLAFRAGLGSIASDSRDAVPADERFYAGGGGSIRGYSYQSVGPLEENNPVGGRSSIELSAELRFRFTNHLGLVSFVDGGSAFETKFPDTLEDLLWAWGVGFRYFTGIGPLRVDFAVPVDRRPDMDDSFQVYVSLGQAF